MREPTVIVTELRPVVPAARVRGPLPGSPTMPVAPHAAESHTDESQTDTAPSHRGDAAPPLRPSLPSEVLSLRAQRLGVLRSKPPWNFVMRPSSA